jgi:hypothetical protein
VVREPASEVTPVAGSYSVMATVERGARSNGSESETTCAPAGSAAAMSGTDMHGFLPWPCRFLWWT